MRRLIVVLTVAAFLPAAARADGGGITDLVRADGRIWTTARDGVVALDARGHPSKARVGGFRVSLLAPAADGRRVWGLRPWTLFRVDTRSKAVRRFPVHGPSYGLALGFGSAWVAGYDGILTRVDQRSGRTTVSIRGIPAAAEGVAVGFGSVWVVGVGPTRRGHGGTMVPLGRGTLARIDPRTNRVVARIPVGRGAAEVAVDAHAVWVASGRGVAPARTVSRIDPRTNRIAGTVRLRTSVGALATGFGSVWAVEDAEATGRLVRIDPRSLRAERRTLGKTWVTSALVAGRHAVWVAGEGSRTITRVDPRTLRVLSVARLA